VFLWFSSIAGGWLENWVVYRKIPDAIALNRRLNAVFGAQRSKDFSDWFTHNISGLGTNLTLGFFLGFTPTVGKFFGLPLSAAHVTLSSAALGISISAIGWHSVDTYALSMAVVGILIIGILNFGVSFVLALAVAARARNIKEVWIWYLLKIVWYRFRQTPREFFLPPRTMD
jgi:site-specific recombinase